MIERKHVIVCVMVFVVGAVGAVSSAEAQQVPEQRFFISVDGAVQNGSQQLQHRVVTPDVYGEDQITETDYNIDRSGAALRTNVTALLFGNLGFGFGYTRSAGTGEGAVTVAVPHPVFVNRPRIASTDLTTLGHREDMFLFEAVFVVPLDDRAQLQIFGGPTVMNVEQAVVTGAIAVEVGPPFTDVTLASVPIEELTKTGVGFNVGMDFAYMFGDSYGAGLFLQYAGGSVDFSDDGGPDSVTVGGIQVGGGIRFRF